MQFLVIENAVQKKEADDVIEMKMREQQVDRAVFLKSSRQLLQVGNTGSGIQQKEAIVILERVGHRLPVVMWYPARATEWCQTRHTYSLRLGVSLFKVDSGTGINPVH